MKKIIFIITSIILSSCATTYDTIKYVTTYTADITRKDYNGQIIDFWENVTIGDKSETYLGNTNISNESSNFNFGNSGVLKFYDKDGNPHFIQGGIISINNVKSNTKEINISKLIEQKREIEEKKVDKLIEKYKEYQDNYIALYNKKPTTNNKTKQRDLAGKIIKTEMKLKEKGIEYLEYRNKDLISGGEDALSEIYRIVDELKHLDESIVTIVDKKELKEAKHKIYELSQTLWEKYNVSYKKL